MKYTMRYITVEENELFKKIAETNGVRGYTTPISLSCHESNLGLEKEFYSWMEEEERKKQGSK